MESNTQIDLENPFLLCANQLFLQDLFLSIYTKMQINIIQVVFIIIL